MRQPSRTQMEAEVGFSWMIFAIVKFNYYEMASIVLFEYVFTLFFRM